MIRSNFSSFDSQVSIVIQTFLLLVMLSHWKDVGCRMGMERESELGRGTLMHSDLLQLFIHSLMLHL